VSASAQKPASENTTLPRFHWENAVKDSDRESAEVVTGRPHEQLLAGIAAVTPKASKQYRRVMGPQTIAQMPHLGTHSEAMLHRVGVTTIDQLRTLGSVAAYLLLRRSAEKVTDRLLWRLEASLSNVRISQISPDRRAEMLRAVAP
jgi:DNA transformation protein and related proteins